MDGRTSRWQSSNNYMSNAYSRLRGHRSAPTNSRQPSQHQSAAHTSRPGGSWNPFHRHAGEATGGGQPRTSRNPFHRSGAESTGGGRPRTSRNPFRRFTAEPDFPRTSRNPFRRVDPAAQAFYDAFEPPASPSRSHGASHYGASTRQASQGRRETYPAPIAPSSRARSTAVQPAYSSRYGSASGNYPTSNRHQSTSVQPAYSTRNLSQTRGQSRASRHGGSSQLGGGQQMVYHEQAEIGGYQHEANLSVEATRGGSVHAQQDYAIRAPGGGMQRASYAVHCDGYGNGGYGEAPFADGPLGPAGGSSRLTRRTQYGGGGSSRLSSRYGGSQYGTYH